MSRSRLPIALGALIVIHAAALAGDRVAPYAPDLQERASAYAAPSAAHLLGTDRFGRDVFSRLLAGARVSLFAGLFAAAIALCVGAAVGGVAGFCRGRVDGVLMGATDVILAMPTIYILLAARGAMPLELGAGTAFLATAALIGFTGWARTARLVRAATLSACVRDYVAAARACGAGDAYVLIRHVMPEVLPVLLTQGAILAPRFVLAEVTLSFVGLGMPEPSPSWGTMAAAAMSPHVVALHWWLVAPLTALVPVFALYDAAAREVGRLSGRPTPSPATRKEL